MADEKYSGPNRRKSIFAWVSLFLTNWTATKGILTVLTLALGAGTVTNPAVYGNLIPSGQVPADSKALDVTLKAMKTAIDANTASVEALRSELRELEDNLTARRQSGDSSLRKEIETLKQLVN